MIQIASEFQPNLATLQQCREQIGLTQEEVKKKVGSIGAIEAGNKRPTYKQLDTLADLYQVPRWVFVVDELPREYQYIHTPAFRKFKDAEAFEDYKVRLVVTRVEQYRDLFIDLHQDMDDPVQPFILPDIDVKQPVLTLATQIRKWLAMADQSLDFGSIKERLEQKGVFIFLTSKYKGWSYVDQAFRGLTITHPIMPIILINNSDSRQAQSFTLMHELGHLLREDTSIDAEGTEETEIEKWCDRLAGEILMPANSPHWQTFADGSGNLSSIKQLAKEFEVSSYACLVRLRQLNKISQSEYNRLESAIKDEHQEMKKKLKESKGGPARDRPREVLEQFGTGFVGTVLSNWHNKEITLHKATRLLGLKRPQQIHALEHHLSCSR